MDRHYDTYTLNTRSLDHERPPFHARDWDAWRGYSSARCRPTGLLTNADRVELERRLERMGNNR